jgi:hypothetical protein
MHKHDQRMILLFIGALILLAALARRGWRLKEVRKGKDQGLDSKTFSAVMRDKARAYGQVLQIP